MEKNLEKSLKRFLKRKVKITTAFIVAFLLGSLSTYGKIIAKYDNASQTIKFYRNGVEVTEEILKSGSITGNATDGFIWNIDKSILEHIEIDGSLTSDGKNFTVKNNGKISGNEAQSGEESAGHGITSRAFVKVENNGIIAGNSGGGRGPSSNGFFVESLSEIDNTGIDNNGIISGEYGGEYSSGNGICFGGGETRLTDLNNNGTIKGETAGNDSNGNGIYLSQWAKITNLKNTGLIRGTSYGIKFANREIENFNNYGVIGGKIGAISKDNANYNNFGLFVKGSGADVTLVESGDKTSEQNGKTIINGVTDDKSALSSLGVSDLNGKTENLIINVAGNKNANGEIINSFNVNENLTLTNSTINGYENAVTLSNGTLTLNGTTVNTEENAVTGSAGDEILNLGADSIINGNIDLGTGQDTILADSSTVNGKIILNDGGKFTSQGTTVINGSISTNGADVNIGGSSVINGTISILKGDVTLGDNISINGNIHFNIENGKIIVGENFSENNFTGDLTGNLKKGILGADYQINGDVSVLNKHLQIFDGIKIVQLKDGVDNNVNLSDITANHFSEIRGGTGNDSFAVSVDKLEKLSLIDGGKNGTAGDTLKIDGIEITNIIKNDENIPVGVDKTFFGKIKNIENLELNSTLGINLDLDGSESGAFQDLNINLGSGMLGSEVSTSISKLNELKSLTGGTKRDTLIIKDVIAENETFDFMKKEDGTSKISSVEKIKFSDKNDTINLDKFNSISSGIKNVYSESGDDKFIASSGILDNFENIDGGDGKDSIEIADTITNSQILKNVFVEKLVLKEAGNSILVDALVEDGAASISRTRFEEITVLNNGTVGDTFTITGDKDDTKRNNIILEMAINGGSSKKDTLKVNTGISTEQLSNKKGIENLVLGNTDNTIDFTYKDQDKNLEDFKNITSGNVLHPKS